MNLGRDERRRSHGFDETLLGHQLEAFDRRFSDGLDDEVLEHAETKSISHLLTPAVAEASTRRGSSMAEIDVYLDPDDDMVAKATAAKSKRFNSQQRRSGALEKIMLGELAGISDGMDDEIEKTLRESPKKERKGSSLPLKDATRSGPKRSQSATRRIRGRTKAGHEDENKRNAGKQSSRTRSISSSRPSRRTQQSRPRSPRRSPAGVKIAAPDSFTSLEECRMALPLSRPAIRRATSRRSPKRGAASKLIRLRSMQHVAASIDGAATMNEEKSKDNFSSAPWSPKKAHSMVVAPRRQASRVQDAAPQVHPQREEVAQTSFSRSGSSSTRSQRARRMLDRRVSSKSLSPVPSESRSTSREAAASP